MSAFKSEKQRKFVMSKLRKRGLIRGKEKVIAYGHEGDYHRFRLKSPTRFKSGSFRTISPTGPNGTKFVIGKLKGQQKTTRQAILVPKSAMRVGGKEEDIPTQVSREEYLESVKKKKEAIEEDKWWSPGGKVGPILTKKEKRMLIKDEKAGQAEYKKLGFRRLAKDERRHEIFIRKQPVK